MSIATGKSESAALKLAYRLYVGYKTQTLEYRKIAESMGLSSGELNSRMWGIYTERRRMRIWRRFTRTA